MFNLIMSRGDDKLVVAQHENKDELYMLANRYVSVSDDDWIHTDYYTWSTVNMLNGYHLTMTIESVAV